MNAEPKYKCPHCGGDVDVIAKTAIKDFDNELVEMMHAPPTFEESINTLCAFSVSFAIPLIIMAIALWLSSAWISALIVTIVAIIFMIPIIIKLYLKINPMSDKPKHGLSARIREELPIIMGYIRYKILDDDSCGETSTPNNPT